jgi:hypothetical protein
MKNALCGELLCGDLLCGELFRQRVVFDLRLITGLSVNNCCGDPFVESKKAETLSTGNFKANLMHLILRILEFGIFRVTFIHDLTENEGMNVFVSEIHH